MNRFQRAVAGALRIPTLQPAPAPEQRATVADPIHPSADAAAEMFSWLGSGSADPVVTPSSAITNMAVLSCVRVLAESIATLPMKLFRRSQEGRSAAVDHAVYRVLHDQGNAEMTAFELREVMMFHLALWGNFYGEIEMNGRADVLGVWPLLPDRTKPVRTESGNLAYVTRMPSGDNLMLPAYRVLHVRGMGNTGLMGMSPIALARKAIGLSQNAEKLGITVYGNGAVPGGSLEHPGKLTEAAYKRLLESWETRHQGVEKANRVAILEEGLKWNPNSMPLSDAEFIESRKFQLTEICRLYRMPPHMIQDLERATFSNIEHQSLNFVVHTLMPWLVRIEQAVSRDLIGERERQQLFAKFSVNGLARGDMKSRYEAYAIGRNWGWLSPNDVRDLEDMNQIPGGDTYLSPLNMSELGVPPPTPEPEPAQEPPADDPGNRTMVAWCLDASTRIAARLEGDWSERHAPWVAGVIRPLLATQSGHDLDARSNVAADMVISSTTETSGVLAYLLELVGARPVDI